MAKPAPIDLRRTTTELRELTEAVISRRGSSDAPFGTYVFGGLEPASELARRVEGDVFDETFGNSPELLAHEYGPYDATSVFCCVIDHRRALPVGTIRLILPPRRAPHGEAGEAGERVGLTPTGLKSLDDIGRMWGQEPGASLRLAALAGGSRTPFDVSAAWDVATLAVVPGYRQGLVSLALYQAVCTSARRAGAAWLVTILDLVVARLVQLRLGRPFQRYPGVEPIRYLDSPASLPYYSDLAAWSARLAANDPTLHETVFEGRGLEDAVQPPDWCAVDELVNISRVGVR